MVSSILGTSGRVYVRGEVLQARRRNNHDRRIYKTECGNESFVLKRVSRSIYDLNQGLAVEFQDSRRLRMHIDCAQEDDQEDHILIYPYFRDTLLALIKNDDEFTVRQYGKLHTKDWIHIDVKPDSIFMNWTCDKDGNKTPVTNAVLGDFDIAFRPEDGRLPLRTPYAIGNVMWRSLEGQTAIGVTRASDVFSFALVCLYALGAGDLLTINNYQELQRHGIRPEQDILCRHFAYFGPVTDGLLNHVNDENWRAALKSSSDAAQEEAKYNSMLPFALWGKDLGPEAQDMISQMTKMDPAARMTIDQVLAHPWWAINT
ncbi:kinase-like domain-containing protein [Apodospora peruviana]|uniref:Kinase-like domain-containing protein n=1 Tax=Apodospora peruviana TaxID=516989 RepID=A0AAE0HU75_9PEZI|nr:kinase-like domain-containing protein [Apodospora peruviana]